MAPQRTALREGCFGEVVFEASTTSTDTHAAACKSRVHMTRNKACDQSSISYTKDGSSAYHVQKKHHIIEWSFSTTADSLGDTTSGVTKCG